MSREALSTTLNLLRYRRHRLINAYCTEDHDLYIHMFSFLPNSPEMEFAISKYFLEWLNTHSTLPSREPEPSSPQFYSPEFVDCYIRAYKKLCELFLVNRATAQGAKSNALMEVVNNKIDNLNLLLEIGLRHEEKLNRLRYLGSL